MNATIKKESSSHARQSNNLNCHKKQLVSSFNSNKIADISTYATPDLMLAAYLRAKGMVLLGSKYRGSRAYFEFEDSSERTQFTREFYNGADVSITEFKGALNEVKSLLRGA